MKTLRIGCIGLGNMGGALIRALACRPNTTISGFDPDTQKAAELSGIQGFVAAPSVELVLQEADFVFLAVKPQIMSKVLAGALTAMRPEACLISIAAGIALEQLQLWSERRCALVRVMPNTPAMVSSGVSAVCFEDPQLTEEQKSTVLEMLALLGQVHVLPEKDFHAFTGLIGSGPAYVFYFMDALVQAGVTAGLSRFQSEKMVAGLLEGSVKLFCETGQGLSCLQHMVTSPAGTTIAAINHLDRAAVRGALVDAVNQAVRRSKELG